MLCVGCVCVVVASCWGIVWFVVADLMSFCLCVLFAVCVLLFVAMLCALRCDCFCVNKDCVVCCCCGFCFLCVFDVSVCLLLFSLALCLFCCYPSFVIVLFCFLWGVLCGLVLLC